MNHATHKPLFGKQESQESIKDLTIKPRFQNHVDENSEFRTPRWNPSQANYLRCSIPCNSNYLESELSSCRQANTPINMCSSNIKDLVHLAFGVISIIIVMLSQISLGIWLTNVGPISIDKKPSWITISLLPSHPLINNISLLLLFVLQHSLMARKMWGAIVTTCLPEGFERVVYNLATVMVIFIVCILWEPLPTIIWDVTTVWLRYSVISVRIIFVLLLLKSVRALDRLTFYGIKQPFCRLRNKKPSNDVELVTTGMYGVVRHPAMSTVMGILLIAPTMSVGHLLFSVSMVIYIVLSVLYLEERDLVQQMGSQYQAYRKTTPAFIPSLWRFKPAKD